MRQKTSDRQPSSLRTCIAALLLLLVLCLGSSVPVSAKAYYVKQSDTTVSLTSSKTGWVKIGTGYYFYNSKHRLIRGFFKYRGEYYYSVKSGKRYGGWVTTKTGKTYYFRKGTGVMLRSRWAGDGKYYYYFGADGVMARNTTIGKYRVDSKGRRIITSSEKPTIKQSGNNYSYSSSTLRISLKLKSTHGVSYWVAHIKTKSPKQLKSALSYGTYGGTRQTTSSAVSSNGGIIGINGSAFDYGTGNPSPKGMCIKNGRIYADYATSYITMAVKSDGTMYTPRVSSTGNMLLKAGVKDTYNFGPILINNGVPQPAIAETNKYYPRSAVGMVKPNEYVIVVTNTGNYSGLNHTDLVRIFQTYNCQYAYNLDGGGSATLYFNGKVMNKLIGGTQRPCADFLYFTR